MENHYIGYEQLLEDWFDEGFKKSCDFKVNHYGLPELDWSSLSALDLIHELEYVLCFILKKTHCKSDEIKFFLSEEKCIKLAQTFISPLTDKTIHEYMKDNYKNLQIYRTSTHIELVKDNKPSFCFAIFFSKEWMETNFYKFSIN